MRASLRASVVDEGLFRVKALNDKVPARPTLWVLCFTLVGANHVACAVQLENEDASFRVR